MTPIRPQMPRRDGRRRRSRLLLATAAVVAVGLGLRLVPLGLPVWLVKYGGSVLWGAMVYGLAAAILPRARGGAVVLAVVVAAAVEFSRLVHTPWLDAFRATPAGALLLGRIFSPWNLVSYAVGIAAARLVDGRAPRSVTGDNPAVRCGPG